MEKYFGVELLQKLLRVGGSLSSLVNQNRGIFLGMLDESEFLFLGEHYMVAQD